MNCQNCPLTNSPCNQMKMYKVNEIVENNFKTLTLCEKCVQNYLNTETTQEEILNYKKKRAASPVVADPKNPASMLKSLIDMFSAKKNQEKTDFKETDSLKTLESKLKKAIKTEDFEKAEKIKSGISAAKELNSEYEYIKEKIIEAVSKEEFKNATKLKKQLTIIEGKYKSLIQQIKEI